MTKFGARLECVLPLGASGFGCQALAAMLSIAPQNYSQIFGLAESILQNQVGISAAQWDVDYQGMPHLYVPSGHSCDSIDYTGMFSVFSSLFLLSFLLFFFLFLIFVD